MDYKIKIAGMDVILRWDLETSRRYEYRAGLIGGEPTPSELRSKKTVATAIFKILWCLLPASLVSIYKDPESLFIDVNHDEETEAIGAAVVAIFSERFADAEKKSTSMKSHSQK